MIKTLITPINPSSRIVLPFNLKDSKGREIGLAVSTSRVLVEEAPEDWKGYFHHMEETGEFIAVRMTVTRNGKEFGSCQPRQYFKTKAESHPQALREVTVYKERGIPFETPRLLYPMSAEITLRRTPAGWSG